MIPELSVEIIFNGKKSVVSLPALKGTTVGDLTKAIEKVIHVPFDKQRLIFKGRSLVEPDALLSDCKVLSGSKLMVLGSVETLDPNEVQKLSKCQELSDAINEDLEKLNQILADTDASKPIEIGKQLKSTIDVMERCMRALELLDSVRLPYDSESERFRRKQLVDQLQEYLLQADKLKEKFLDLRKK